MFESTEDLFGYLLISLVLFFVGVLITRAIFSVPRFLRYQRAQIKLMALMAHQNGIAEAKIQKILREADGSADESNLEIGNETQVKEPVMETAVVG